MCTLIHGSLAGLAGFTWLKPEEVLEGERIQRLRIRIPLKKSLRAMTLKSPIAKEIIAAVSY
ncbi:hypothetical protein WN51_14299 [Melipona quadrifasciata]|uniref:Uncharacterized protein n=1 Tax=Melipona quadrifasciata TaxID=166423 RepID=A0A0N0U5H5_9HYME|nr:hypothetical protein WN51_14299 [Melipona quadrifasciata]